MAGHAEPPTQPAGVLAGFGARLGANLLDGLFLSLISLVATIPLGLFVRSRWETTLEPCTSNGQPDMCDVATDDAIGALLVALAIWAIFSLFLALVYHVRAVAKTGQTPGRKILGIKVVDTATGQPPSFGKTLLRYFVSGFSGSVCLLGYLWMLWDRNNQTWHDKAASTVVVRA